MSWADDVDEVPNAAVHSFKPPVAVGATLPRPSLLAPSLPEGGNFRDSRDGRTPRPAVAVPRALDNPKCASATSLASPHLPLTQILQPKVKVSETTSCECNKNSATRRVPLPIFMIVWDRTDLGANPLHQPRPTQQRLARLDSRTLHLNRSASPSFLPPAHNLFPHFPLRISHLLELRRLPPLLHLQLLQFPSQSRL